MLSVCVYNDLSYLYYFCESGCRYEFLLKALFLVADMLHAILIDDDTHVCTVFVIVL